MFVADFIGSPPMNFLHCDAGFDPDARAVKLKDVSIPIPEIRERRPGGPLVLGVRPEHIRFSDAAPVRGRVFGAEYLGTTQIVTVDDRAGHDQGAAAVERAGASRRDGGSHFPLQSLSLFDAQTGVAHPQAICIEERAPHG